MKLYNILVDEKVHLCVDNRNGLIDLTAISEDITMESAIRGENIEIISAVANGDSTNTIQEPIVTNVVSSPVKLVCVGLNYKAHADGAGMGTVMNQPILFSKFFNSIAPDGGRIELPRWEDTYDYEAELVIVIGKTAWNISADEAMDYVFGFTCGNDLSCRDAQKRSSQWLIGKALPGFGPCGPCIVSKDEVNLNEGLHIRSFVNGELRQDGNTLDMIFDCSQIVSYASRYIKLEPGDLIFTGTPAGVQLEKQSDAKWLVPGDKVEVEIESIGTLTNYMV